MKKNSENMFSNHKSSEKRPQEMERRTWKDDFYTIIISCIRKYCGIFVPTNDQSRAHISLSGTTEDPAPRPPPALRRPADGGRARGVWGASYAGGRPLQRPGLLLPLPQPRQHHGLCAPRTPGGPWRRRCDRRVAQQPGLRGHHADGLPTRQAALRLRQRHHRRPDRTARERHPADAHLPARIAQQRLLRLLPAGGPTAAPHRRDLPGAHPAPAAEDGLCAERIPHRGLGLFLLCGPRPPVGTGHQRDGGGGPCRRHGPAHQLLVLLRSGRTAHQRVEGRDLPAGVRLPDARLPPRPGVALPVLARQPAPGSPRAPAAAP